jgi:hypothetical protein
MQGAQGQFTSSKGPERMGNLQPWTRITFPSKILSFSNYGPGWFFMCVQKKKSSLCRLKINHTSGSETCVYSWYAGSHGSEQLLWFLIIIHSVTNGTFQILVLIVIINPHNMYKGSKELQFSSMSPKIRKIILLHSNQSAAALNHFFNCVFGLTDN